MTFFSNIPVNVYGLLSELEELGFSFCLVGGAVRDYLFDGKIGHDLDFEIRSKTSMKTSEWPKAFSGLHEYLKKQKIPFNELPYLITRIHCGDYELEVSSPRVENLVLDNLSHHHFEAVLDPNLSYENSFRRRDLTINAIGMEVSFKDKTEKIIDPYNGTVDLKAKNLKPVTDDFFKDSVRLLRLIRFSLNFKTFLLDEKFILKLCFFDLTELSVYHFKSEMLKSSSIGDFLNRFHELVKTHKIKIPKKMMFLNQFTYDSEIKTIRELLVFLFSKNKDNAQSFVQLFSLPKKDLLDLTSFSDSYQAIKKLEKRDVEGFLKLPQNEALAMHVMKDIKNLEDKKEWRDLLKISGKDLVISWCHWEKITIDQSEMDKIPNPLRSYYRYYKAMKGL